MNFKILKNLKNKVLSNPENYVLLIFILVSLALLTKIIGGNAWITVSFFLLTIFLLWAKLQDLVTSSLLITIFSFQFYVPNKYYIIEVFKFYELESGIGSYVLGYGVNLENIFLLITVILIIRNLILKGKTSQKSDLIFIVPIILSAILFFLVSLYSSLYFSPYANLSVTWLLQYMQMFFLGFSILYVFLNRSNNFKLISLVFLSSIALQSVISIIQFVKQSWIGLPIESARYNTVFFGAPDAVRSFFRVMGTFGQSNQFSLVLTVMLVLIIPTAIEKKQPSYILGSIIAVTSILLSQSRSGWLSLTMVFLITAFMYKGELLKFASLWGVKRIFILITLIVLSTSIVVIPRLAASFNAFDRGGSVPLRVEMIREAILAINQNPWIGYGIGTNEPVLLRLFPRGYNYAFPAPVHIGYIQLLLESGVLGFIFFLFPFAYIVRCIINQYFIWGIRKMEKIKSYVFITLAGITVFAVFYLFQPYEGFRDFSYLGIILGYGIVCLKLFKKSSI